MQESAIIPNMVGEENDESLTANNANNKTDSNKNNQPSHRGDENSSSIDNNTSAPLSMLS